jgi:hypothetical protein
MKKVLLAVFAGLALGSFAAQATLPAAPAKSEAEKKAEADKAAAAKAKAAADLTKAQDRAVANYKRSHGAMQQGQAKKK